MNYVKIVGSIVALSADNHWIGWQDSRLIIRVVVVILEEWIFYCIYIYNNTNYDKFLSIIKKKKESDIRTYIFLLQIWIHLVACIIKIPTSGAKNFNFWIQTQAMNIKINLHNKHGVWIFFRVSIISRRKHDKPNTYHHLLHRNYPCRVLANHQLPHHQPPLKKKYSCF